MWFALGFVTLVVSVGYQWWSRWHRIWSGRPGRISEVKCETKVRKFRGMVLGLCVAMDAPVNYKFELKREGGIDRFFKWTGVAVEFQLGHARLDPLVYVASDDQHLLKSLIGNERLLDSIQQLFLLQLYGCPVKRVACAGGRLWMEIGTSDWFDDDGLKNAKRAAERLIKLLAIVATELQAAAPDAIAPTRDRYLLPTVAILSLSTGLAVNTVFSWLRTWFVSQAFIVDTQRFWAMAWIIGLLLSVALVAATLFFLNRSSRVHLVLLELGLVGVFGAVGTSAAELRNANIDWDTSPAMQIEQKVVSKSVGISGRGGTRTYYLKVNDWAHTVGFRSVRVSESTYEKASIGDTLQFEQHAGYLGWRWAEFKGWKPAAAQASPPT